MIALDPGGTFDFSIPDDRDEQQPTVFRLAVLRSSQLAELRRRVGEDSMDKLMESPDLVEELLRAVVRGWRNFRDQAGRDVPYRPERATLLGRECDALSEDDALRIPPRYRAQMVAAALLGQHIDTTDAGNSTSPPG